MLRNTRVAAFTVSKLLKKNQQRREGGDYPSSPSTHLVRVKYSKKKKMKFSIRDFFSKCDRPNPQFPADLVTFTAEILNGKRPIFSQKGRSFEK